MQRLDAMSQFRPNLLPTGLLGMALASCSPLADVIPCEMLGYLPYQYEVETSDDNYFAVLLPMPGSDDGQRFFVLEESKHPVTDLSPYSTGDPAGFVVEFARFSGSLEASRLGLKLSDDELAKLGDRGLKQFTDGEKTFSLVSCDGIWSRRFREEFPALSRTSNM